MRPGADYFLREPRRNSSVPASFLERVAPEDAPPLEADERTWTLGEIVTARSEAGLHIEALREHSNHFWPHFPALPPEIERRVPHTFSLLARKPE